MEVLDLKLGCFKHFLVQTIEEVRILVELIGNYLNWLGIDLID